MKHMSTRQADEISAILDLIHANRAFICFLFSFSLLVFLTFEHFDLFLLESFAFVLGFAP